MISTKLCSNTGEKKIGLGDLSAGLQVLGMRLVTPFDCMVPLIF
uniref:Uncharacterized protein n=1 Tax=Arundo donax TaxID=35708 RepID=A0A0A9BCH1_ARUDO